VGGAGARAAGPAAGHQVGRDHSGHLTRPARDIPPAEAEHQVTGSSDRVVPAQVAKGLVRWMRLTAVQLHHRGELQVPDVVVTTSTGCLLGLVTQSGREPMGALYPPRA